MAPCSFKAMRSRYAYTQKDVSSAIGISVSNLSALENNKRNLAVELAANFPVLYGTRVESLLFPNGLKSMEGHSSLIKKAEKLKDVS